MRITVIALMILAGCGNTSRTQSTYYLVTDSAGVEIVQNGSNGYLGDGFLQLHPELRIGEIDGPEPLRFHRVAAVTVGSDGTLHIANNGSVEVRRFTGDGEYMGSLGGRGSGPGEFQHISAILPDGQHVYVIDSRLNRATVFAEDGTLMETIPLTAGAARLLPLSRTGSGWIVLVMPMAGAHIPQPGVTYQDTAQVAWVSALPYVPASPTPMKVLVRHPRVRLHGIAAEGGGVASAAALWQAEAAHAVDAQGRVYAHNGSDYNISVTGPDGRTVRQIRAVHDPVPITRDLLDRHTKKVTTFFDTSRVDFPIGRAAELGRLRLPHPGVLPALGRLLVSRGGEVWVERPARTPDPVRLEFPIDGPPETVWDVFDESGRFMGGVQFPSGFTPRAVAGSGRVIGVLKDEFDVEYVVRYRIAAWREGERTPPM
jgi:hypothetical protein